MLYYLCEKEGAIHILEELRDFYKDIEYLTLTIPEEARSPEEVFEKLRDFSLKSKQWSIEFYG